MCTGKAVWYCWKDKDIEIREIPVQVQAVCTHEISKSLWIFILSSKYDFERQNL